jgi:hypothetical protein
LLDDPVLIAGAAEDVELDAEELERWCSAPEVGAALEEDIAAARAPAAAARALDHKLGGPRGQRRYTAPSYELRRSDRDGTVVVPGFNPVEAYEAALANLAPELERRPRPANVAEVLTWAEEPLATAEVAAVAQLDATSARAALARVARPLPAGADFYWTLES